MQLTVHEIARMIDLSAVRTDSDLAAVRELARQAIKYNCIIAYVLPSFVPELKKLLAGAPEVGVGAPVGFPSGGHTTGIKVAEARQLIADGVAELDMVANVGMLLSGRYDYVEEDIRQVVDAAEGIPIKVILECHYLGEEEIRKGSELCVRAGANWIKTGTGWTPTGATLENISLIRNTVGDDIKVKASGGVRGLETLAEMYRRGARRFGVSLVAGARLLEQCAALPGGAIDF